jgi:hypothetical protein
LRGVPILDSFLSFNIQHPKKLQIPNSKNKAWVGARRLEVWCLVFLWSLAVGCWSFSGLRLGFRVFGDGIADAE